MALPPTYFYDDKTITSSSVIQGKDASQLNMDDFFNLLVAQLTNQDMMNPTNDTEFIAQMAQFSALQGVQTIQEYQLSSYAASYIGKFVTIASVNDAGEMETIIGKVDSITYYDGNPKVVVNGKPYDLFTVMEINDADGSGALAQAVKLKGKDVILKVLDEDGNETELAGTVTNAGIANGEPYVTVNGKNYALSDLLYVDGIPADEYFANEGQDPAFKMPDISKMSEFEFNRFFAYFQGKPVVFNDGSSGTVTGFKRLVTGGNDAYLMVLEEEGAEPVQKYFSDLIQVDKMPLEDFLVKNKLVGDSTAAPATQSMSASTSASASTSSSISDAHARGVHPWTGEPLKTEEELRREVNYDSQKNDDDRFTSM